MSDPCTSLINHFMNPPATVAIPTLQSSNFDDILGRPLTPDQHRILQEVINERAFEYSPSSFLVKQRKLQGVGFKPNEIQTIRSQLIRPRTRASLSAQVSVKVIEGSSSPLNARHLLQSRTTEMPYFIDSAGKVHVMPKPISASDDALGLIYKTSDGKAVIPLETGTFKFNPKTNQYVFRPNYIIDENLAQSLSQNYMDDVAPQSPGGNFSRSSAPLTAKTSAQTKIFNCMDILAAQQAGKGGLIDRVIAQNVTFAGAVAITELSSAGRLQTEQGRQVIMADLIGYNVGAVTAGIVYPWMTNANLSISEAFAGRIAVAAGLYEVQGKLYEGFISENPGEQAEKLSAFNKSYFLGTLPMYHYLDVFIQTELPKMIFSACLNNRGITQIVFGPRSVRIYERTGSIILYLSARDLVIGE